MLERQRRELGQLLTRQRQQIDRRHVPSAGVGLEAGQRQQLRHHARGAVDAGLELAQRAVAVGPVRRLQGVLGVDAQHRERGAQLVRGVGQETALALEQRGHLQQQAVERGHHRLQLLRHVAHLERRQLVGVALLESPHHAP